MPCGNQKFLKQKHGHIINAARNKLNGGKIKIINENVFDVLEKIIDSVESNGNGGGSKLFIYLDPPYLNTNAVYNEGRGVDYDGWSISDDLKLFNLLNKLNALNVKWALSNVLKNKSGVKNSHLEQWAIDNGYNIIHFEDKQYYSCGKSTGEGIR